MGKRKKMREIAKNLDKIREKLENVRERKMSKIEGK